MRVFYKSKCIGLIVIVAASILAFQTAGEADGLGLTVTITQAAPIETLASTGNIIGVTSATIGTKMILVSADASHLTLQDAQGTRYLISPSATDYTPPTTATSSNPGITNSIAQISPAITNAPTVPPATPSALTPSSAPAPLAISSNAPSSPNQPASVDLGAPLVFDCEIQPQDNFSKAAYPYWSPPYDQQIRGVIVMVPGLSGDGRGMVSDPAWQNLARKYHLALVACFLQGKDYYDAMRGTGDALLEALKNFAQKTTHPEISRAPLLLYGESAGGQFNYDFVLWKPQQVMAFVVNKGGYYDQMEPDGRTRSVPGLFFLGQKDSDLRINAITSIWTNGRKRGALWALAPQPDSGHEFSKTAPVAREFFDAVLRSRLPVEGAAGEDTPQMNSMEETQGWIGDLSTHEIHDGSNDSESNHNASWLPDESSAKAWKAFVSGQS